MATVAIAGSTDKVLTLGFPGVLKEVGMQILQASPTWSLIERKKETWEGESIQAGVVTNDGYVTKAQSYQNDDTVDTTSVEPVSAVQFELGGYQSSVNLSGMKIRKVETSPRKLMGLQKLETRLAIIGLVERMSIHLFQAANDAKGVLSLATISDATTTIAGLAGSGTWGGTTTASGVFSAQGKTDLMTLYSTLSVNATFDESNSKSGLQNEPDVSITRRQESQLYWASLEPSMRYTAGGTGDVKLMIAFMGHPIVIDQHVTSGQWHMFRKSSLHLRVMSAADFTPLSVATSTTQPDMWSRGLIWNGQLVFNSRREFGKLTGLS